MNTTLVETTTSRLSWRAIAAGAVVLEGTICEGGSIYAGVPAKKIKNIPEEMISGEIERIANNYVRYADWFRETRSEPEA